MPQVVSRPGRTGQEVMMMMMMMMRDLKSVRGLAKTHQTKPSSDALL